jgi:hypothetical protein
MLIYHWQIAPLVEPTRIIMSLERPPYEWHEFFPNCKIVFYILAYYIYILLLCIVCSTKMLDFHSAA